MENEFVILVHSGYGPIHYDLMLRRNDTLVTWQIPYPPETFVENKPVGTRKILDHRLAYLDHEGPISKARGSVVRADKGSYEVIAMTETYWCVRLHGKKINGRFELRLQGPDPNAWTMTRVRDDDETPPANPTG